MLTAWGKKLTNLSPRGTTIPDMDGSGQHYGVVAGKSVVNQDIYIPYNSTSSGYNLRIATFSENAYDGIYVGTGSTAPTENDYALESVISSGITGSISKTNIYDQTNEVVGIRFTLTLSNTTSEDIAVSEVAKCVRFNTASTSWGNPNAGSRCVMIDRSVLAEPVTVPAGEAAVIYYDFIYYDGSDSSDLKVSVKN